MTTDALLRTNAILIDGRWEPADDGATVEVTDPADGRSIGVVPRAGAAETRRAVGAAERAFPAFRALTAQERADMLLRLHDAILDNLEDLAGILTAEQGKPLAEARAEVRLSAAYIRWNAEEARRIYGDVIPSPVRGRKLFVDYAPIGVCAAITPWNFPSSMLSRKVGPALAAGCTMVIKPASQTPFSALAWGVLAEKAGLPPGVINIVTGNAREIGAELTSNSVVRKVSFTGSTEVGKTLLSQSASTVKKVSMELGGNAPFIVFDDADLEDAVEGAIAAKYRNSGQTCVCTNRFLVQAGIHDTFLECLAERTAKLRLGRGTDPEVDQGPLIDAAAVQTVQTLVSEALAEGAELVTGGEADNRGATYFRPTVLASVRPDMRIAREEIFGPVATVFRFETEKEAVALANDTPFGLASYLFTRDLGRAFRVSDALDYGMVGVNSGIITTEVAPFGGVKDSGLGVEGGRAGIQEYLVSKYVALGGLSAG